MISAWPCARLIHSVLIYNLSADAKKLVDFGRKPRKCVIFLLCELIEKVRNDTFKWIRKIILQWHHFHIKSNTSTKTISFFIGPKAGSMNWAGKTARINLRIQAIRQACAPIKIGMHSFNSRVVPVTSFVAQLLAIPAKFFQLGRAMLHTAFVSLKTRLAMQKFSIFIE
jgi:hypothetical protein